MFGKLNTCENSETTVVFAGRIDAGRSKPGVPGAVWRRIWKNTGKFCRKDSLKPGWVRMFTSGGRCRLDNSWWFR